MTKNAQPYDQTGALSELYLKRLRHIEDTLAPTFALLLNDGFTYNDVRCMLLDSTIEFVVQQSFQQIKDISKAK